MIMCDHILIAWVAGSQPDCRGGQVLAHRHNVNHFTALINSHSEAHNLIMYDHVCS